MLTGDGTIKAERVGIGHKERQRGLETEHTLLHGGFLPLHDIGGIGDDDVGLGERLRQYVAAEEADIGMVGLRILTRHSESGLRDIASRHLPTGMPMLESDGDTAAAGAYIKDAEGRRGGGIERG